MESSLEGEGLVKNLKEKTFMWLEIVIVVLGNTQCASKLMKLYAIYLFMDLMAIWDGKRWRF